MKLSPSTVVKIHAPPVELSTYVCQNLHKSALKLNDPVAENPKVISPLFQVEAVEPMSCESRHFLANSNDDRLFSPKEIGCKQPVETEAAMRTGDTRQRIVDKQKPPNRWRDANEKAKKTSTNIHAVEYFSRSIDTSLGLNLSRSDFLHPFQFSYFLFIYRFLSLPPPSSPAIVLAFARTIATF